jgi:hypothetical protein
MVVLALVLGLFGDSVFGQKRDGQVIPAVSRVEQAIGVVLGVVFTWEEHQQATVHCFLDALDHG